MAAVGLNHALLSGLENMPLKTWSSCGLNEFKYRETDQKINRPIEWSVHELVTSAQLGVEGRVMHNCVGSYADRCHSGERAIWSIRVVDLETEEPETMHVLTVAIDPKKRTVTEARGKYNLKPFDGKRVSVVKGKATNANARELQRILSESSLKSCEIHITGNGRVEFEGAVPRKIQQAVRNVLIG